jgi:hypothetical protein
VNVLAGLCTGSRASSPGWKTSCPACSIARGSRQHGEPGECIFGAPHHRCSALGKACDNLKHQLWTQLYAHSGMRGQGLQNRSHGSMKESELIQPILHRLFLLLCARNYGDLPNQPHSEDRVSRKQVVKKKHTRPLDALTCCPTDPMS